MPFTLAHLPTELLEMIATALAGDFAQAYSEEGKVICTLRSTCREARDKLDTKFFSTYFTSRYLWLEERKVAELDTISQRPDLADRLTELSVVCKADPGDLNDAFEAGQSLVAPGGVARTLGAILGRLKNLESLDFVDAANDKLPPAGPGHDVSSTFTALMLALGLCKRSVKDMCFHSDDSQSSRWRVVGLPDPRTLLCLAPSLAMLERLDLSTFCAPILTNKVLSGTRIGSELAVALGRCTQLKELSLRMLYTNEASEAFGTLASTLELPRLRYFKLYVSSCTISDLNIFLLRNAVSLRHLNLENVVFLPDSSTTFTSLLDMMLKHLSLTTIEVRHLRIYATDGSGHRIAIGFPGLSEVFWYEEPDDDDFTIVETFLDLEGAEGLHTELTQMKTCVTYTLL
ncbi:hypothetical protein LTR97_007712 [Elasticomyces elasticus]|uniref:Uncharacterized protein n=1 Tax=Elasticomyces elasticus TaxID=574655 RepID=A0AAN7W9K5_9PEZI|nr:hypothetical protein LTR97_007712 [Elasticomyces elasticus]KAK5727597.1 hypothetical protein LTR15_003498 [Elasticomyces elasticus]